MSRYKAVLWDLGGVLFESPFDAFARYEERQGLPAGFLRTVNSTNPDSNAWARMERGEVSLAEFAPLFESECQALGHAVSAIDVLACLTNDLRPEMLAAVHRCRNAGLTTGAITNNHMPFAEVPDGIRLPQLDEVLAAFDHVIESSVVGVRKPDPRIYEMACEQLGVLPDECVFLDDLGINLKPARALGMTTIKVGAADVALANLEAHLGFPVRG